MKNIRKEKEKLYVSHENMRYRKITSNAFIIEKVRRIFRSFIVQCRNENYPFDFHIVEHGDKSMPTIQISASSYHTGAFKMVPAKDESGLPFTKTEPIIEEGGSIVVSFFLNGRISIFIYPRHSSVMKAAEDQLVIFNAIDPRDITDRLIDSALKKFLFYIRVTTYITDNHSFSIRDRLSLYMLRINDVRFKYKLIDSIRKMNNEWGKIFLAAFFTWLVTIITTAPK